MKSKKLIGFGLVIIMLLQLVLTSCSNKTDDNLTNENDLRDEEEILASVPESWNLELASYDVDVPYEVPKYTPDAGGYEVNGDLSSLFNAGQYTGFTENQIKSIYEDGFAILKPSNEVLKMHHVYEFPMYKESPVFITVDSALHLYHLFYNNSLKYIELSSLYDKLFSMSHNVFWESIKAYMDPENENIKEELKFVSAYFMTACKILGTNLDDIDIPVEISSVVDEEIKLINEASDFNKSPILEKDMDYSQFTVRGHYTGNEKLEKYFKCMMWYSLSGFPVFLEGEIEPTLDTDNLIKGMIITCLTLKDHKNFISYENIYSTTALYTGMSDDLGIFVYRDLITNVYGKNPNMNIFKDSSYSEKLLEEALLLPEPEIKGKYTSVSTPVGRQFRFMGQRYSFDAEVMQELMTPIERPIPSGLDVISSFGNLRAEALLDEYYKPKEQWSDYEENLKVMREKEDALTDDDWQEDLYNGWLWSIKSSSASFEDVEGMPTFMRSKKWTDKNIHTALGSYAELKHDSILYKKQSGAEMGGGMDEISIPYNYVEPNVEVYAKLKWLAENTKENLFVRNMLDANTQEILESIIEMQETLMNVSVKELTNQNITEEENMKLYSYGGRIDNIYQSMNSMLLNEGIDNKDDYTTALIADVATIAPNNYVLEGQYLEIGNGLPCEIYVVCKTNGKTYLARGALFNYYEFLSDKRFTDTEWNSLLGVKNVAMVYDKQKNIYIQMDMYNEKGEYILDEDIKFDFESVEITEPSPYMIPKPEWTNSFISAEGNNIDITRDMNLDWTK